MIIEGVSSENTESEIFIEDGLDNSKNGIKESDDKI